MLSVRKMEMHEKHRQLPVDGVVRRKKARAHTSASMTKGVAHSILE